VTRCIFCGRCVGCVELCVVLCAACVRRLCAAVLAKCAVAAAELDVLRALGTWVLYAAL
jgi:hypothetical protein